MLDIRLQEPMSEHTSWRVGGPADTFVVPHSIQDLAAYLKTTSQEEPITFCGLGSNLLVRDGGVRGSVIWTQRFLHQVDVVAPFTLRAEAGVSCASLARLSARQNLAGLEFLAGIPGTVGGAMAMNAGCHGGETWDYLTQVELIDRHGRVQILPASHFSYQYRHVDIPHDHWFVAGHFTLKSGDKNQSLEKIRALLDYRSQTQPTNEPSGGSTFRNPPHDFAARLIEASDLKGYRIGGAEVSMKHANFIVNTGSALAFDIEKLIEHVQNTVEAKQGIRLILEVRVIGESA